MADYTGKVKYYNEEKEYGYIAVSGRKDVIFFTHGGKNPCQLGDIVAFDIRMAHNRNTGAEYETAVSVYPVEEQNGKELQEENEPEAVLQNESGQPVLPKNVQNTDAGISAEHATVTADDANKEVSAETASEKTAEKWKKEPKYQLDHTLEKPIKAALEQATGETCDVILQGLNLSGIGYDIREAGNTWLLGKSEYLVRVGGRISHVKIREGNAYDKTVHGCTLRGVKDANAENGSRVVKLPAYGCASFFINKELCTDMIEYTRRAGIDPEFYELIFVDRSQNKVYVMNMKKLQQLIDFGYKHKPLGEYPSKPNFTGACTMRYLLPTDAFEMYPIPQAE